jgi:hypothetical protein
MRVKLELELTHNEKISYTLNMRGEDTISKSVRMNIHDKVDKVLEAFSDSD